MVPERYPVGAVLIQKVGDTHSQNSPLCYPQSSASPVSEIAPEHMSNSIPAWWRLAQSACGDLKPTQRLLLSSEANAVLYPLHKYRFIKLLPSLTLTALFNYTQFRT